MIIEHEWGTTIVNEAYEKHLDALADLLDELTPARLSSWFTGYNTYDLSTLSGVSPVFSTVTSALFVATSNRTATTTLATIAGTVITVVGAGIAADAGWLFAVGE